MNVQICNRLASALLVLLLAAPASAQNPARDWTPLARLLAPGARVELDLADGTHVEGTVLAHEGERFVFSPKTRLPVAPWRIDYSEIRSIDQKRHSDGMRPGTKVLLGIGIGAGLVFLLVGIVLTATYSTYSFFFRSCSMNRFAVATVVCALLMVPLTNAQAPRMKEVKIRGYVTEFRSPTDFDIEDYRVTRDQTFALDFENASSDVTFQLQDIRVGVELEIKGSLNEQTGELKAKAIKVDLEQFKSIKQTAFVSSAPEGIQLLDGSWAGELRADGQTIRVTNATTVVFKPTKREKKLAEQQKKNVEAEQEDVRATQVPRSGDGRDGDDLRRQAGPRDREDPGGAHRVLHQRPGGRRSQDVEVAEDLRQGSAGAQAWRAEDRQSRQVQAAAGRRGAGLHSHPRAAI